MYFRPWQKWDMNRIIPRKAMKMENDIVAPCDGTVASVAAKGTSVNTDDVLATLS